MCSRLKIRETQPVSSQIFATCRLHHAHVRKDTRLSPLFRTASDGKLSGAWERGYVLIVSRLGETKVSILSLHDGEEPENDTTSYHQIPLFIFGEGWGWGGGGGQVLRLSKQDTAQKQVWVRPGIEGTRPPLTFGIMSGTNFCPPKPGSMVITRTMSTRETKGTTSSTGVPGLMPIPT